MTKTLEIFFGLHECVTYFSCEPIYPPLFNGQHFCQNLGHKDKKVCRIMWLPAVGLGLLTVNVIIFCYKFFRMLSYINCFVTIVNTKIICCFYVLLIYRNFCLFEISRYFRSFIYKIASSDQKKS